MRNARHLLILAGAAVSASAFAADEGNHEWSLDVRGSLFSSAENRTYGGFDARCAFQPGWQAGLRAGFAKVSNANSTAAIRTGGTDFELYVRYAVTQVDGLWLTGGVAFPNTPAQDGLHLTFGADYMFKSEPGQPTFGIGGRGVKRGNNSIIGLSACGAFPMSSGLEAFGDVTAVVHGENTRSVGSGLTARNALYGLGVRYTPATMGEGMGGSFYVMYGNSLGMTTGLSLSSALGNRGGFSFGFVLRGRS